MTQKQIKPKKNITVKKETLPVNVNYSWMIITILILTLIAFIPVFKAEFVSWDDPDYVTQNQSIRSLGNFKEIVTSPVQGNFHPITMLSLAVNYASSGKNAGSYHVMNLLFHLMNIVLVFFFVFRLSGKKPWIDFITALIFGLHPLHVESVAWVSERKDVLYSFFFLGGLLSYLNFLEKGKYSRLLIVLVFFLLSLLSKPAAVIFPLVLIALDYYYGRLNLKSLLEKIPFFLLSLLFGILTVQAQSKTGAVAGAGLFPGYFRFFFGFYGIMMYIIKTLLPINLCTFYPFPAVNNALPNEYYISVAFGAALVTGLIFSLRKQKLIAFSILFFLINLLLVLQFMPVGSAIIADRYTYLPLIGIFIIPAFFFQNRVDKNKGKVPSGGFALLAAISIILLVMTYSQAATWKNSATLWDKAISVSPSSKAYTNRGLVYKLNGNNEKAVEMYSQAIKMNKVEKDALVNRGNIYFNTQKYDLAISDYNACLSIDSTDQLALENRGASYGLQGKYDLALRDMDAALRHQPKSANGYANRATILQLLNRHQEAIDDYYRHMKNTPDENGNVWNSMGTSYQALKQQDKAITCFDEALKLNNSAVFYYNRSVSYHALGNNAKAREDAEQSIKLGAKIDPAFLNQLR